MNYQVFTLQNGIRLLYKKNSSDISHSCIILNAGSRDEEPGKPGMAHFIEHMLFKRTEKRSTSQILNRLELVGADLNAYTTKEYTCIHASFLNAYLERTLDLFEDILFHSVFPESEMEKEKGVILDEINSYQDQPEDAINDDFENLIFEGHSLGSNILGTPDSVRAFTRNDVLNFIGSYYNTDEIIIGVLGSYDFEKLKKSAVKYFDTIPEKINKRKREIINLYQAVRKAEKKTVSQSHCVLGGRAYPIYHEYKTGLLLLNNVLGGTGMSSRLNLEVREKYGIAYTIESNYSPLSDTGIFSIYFGTDAEKKDKALKIILRELKKLRDLSLGTLQLHQAKQKFIGQIALGEENHIGVIISMSKSLLDYNRVDSLKEVFEKINAVTSSQLLEIANEIFDPVQLTELLFEPQD